MNWINFRARWDQLSVQNITLRFTIVSLLFVIITQSLVIAALYNKQRVVFIPPKVDREFYIASEGPSASYLQMMGEYTAGQLMNFTSSNVISRFNSILPLLSSANHNNIKTMLTRQAESVIKANISQVFFPKKFDVDEKLKTIGIFGPVRRIVVDQVTAEKDAVLWIKYVFTGGKFEIEALSFSTENADNPYRPGAVTASR